MSLIEIKIQEGFVPGTTKLGTKRVTGFFHGSHNEMGVKGLSRTLNALGVPESRISVNYDGDNATLVAVTVESPKTPTK